MQTRNAFRHIHGRPDLMSVIEQAGVSGKATPIELGIVTPLPSSIRFLSECERAAWPRISAVRLAIPVLALGECRGSCQMHQFVTEFHQSPVVVTQRGYVDYLNPELDLSGLGSEAACQAPRKSDSPDWMTIFYRAIMSTSQSSRLT